MHRRGRGWTRLAPALAITFALVPPSIAWGHGRIDGVEHIFGATNISAVTGHGRLAVGVSADGDVTVLSWPNPSFVDQLAYMTSNAIDARDRPRFGAPEGAGIHLGLLIERIGGQREVTWLRDRKTWSIAQDYGDADGANPRTIHTSESLGLTVAVVDAVAPTDSGTTDVFVRHVDVQRTGASPVESAWLLSYANLSPQPPNALVEELPVADWAYDGRNDFAALWDAANDAVLHFHPEDQRVYDEIGTLISPPAADYGPIGDMLAMPTIDDATVEAQVTSLDDDYARGTYVAFSTLPAPDQHQIGFDATPMCDVADEIADNVLLLPDTFPDLSLPVGPEVLNLLRCPAMQVPVPVEQGWMYPAEDGFGDAADGELSNASVAAGEVNEALRTPLSFAGDQAEAGLVLAFGPTAAEARNAIAEVTDPDAVVQEAEASLSGWLQGRRLPTEAPADVRRIARRALINIRVGTDIQTGAIVASISRQPPYGLDWPRDGAFFNVLLDVSGQSTLVTQRAGLYAQWQRKEPATPNPFLMIEPPPNPDGSPSMSYPAGAWEMNYYANGSIGGVFRFEIDNAGFAVWTLVAHAGWVDAPMGYLRDHWDAIRLGADLLSSWRDPETLLQAPAQEDDNPGYVRTLHGAVTTFAALDIAGRAARLIGEDEDAEHWEQRGAELRDAILEHLYDEQAGRFVRSPGDTFSPDDAPRGAAAWLVFPCRVLPYDDPRILPQIMGDLDLVAPTIDLQTAGGSYFMKTTLAAAAALHGIDAMEAEALRARVLEDRDRLADHASPTDHFGEVMMVFDGQPDQRVANPHLWEGALFYLTAIAAEDPGALHRFDDVLPPSRIPAAPVPEDEGTSVTDDAGSSDDTGTETDTSGEVSDGGCGCRQHQGAVPTPLWAVILWGAARRRRGLHLSQSQ